MTSLWASLAIAGVVLLWVSLWVASKRPPAGNPKWAIYAVATGMVAGSLFLLVGLIGVFAS